MGETEMIKRQDTIRVSDPILRALVGLIGAITTWALVQVHKDSTAIQISAHRITSLENAFSSSMQEVKQEIREIRRLVENGQKH